MREEQRRRRKGEEEEEEEREGRKKKQAHLLRQCLVRVCLCLLPVEVAAEDVGDRLDAAVAVEAVEVFHVLLPEPVSCRLDELNVLIAHHMLCQVQQQLRQDMVSRYCRHRQRFRGPPPRVGRPHASGPWRPNIGVLPYSSRHLGVH
eukprot:460565-Hanusia_phi.AAC.1